MPTYLRKFYMRELIDIKKEEQAAVKKANQQAQSSIPKRPNINPRLKG